MNATPTACPTLILTGSGHLQSHRTQHGGTVPRLFFTAADDFEFDGRLFPRAYFDHVPGTSGILLDWSGRTDRVRARTLGLRQALTIAITKNDRGYWTLIDVTDLGRVQPDKSYDIFADDLMPYLDQPQLPPLVRSQLIEHRQYVRKGPFDFPPYRRFYSPSGTWKDLAVAK